MTMTASVHALTPVLPPAAPALARTLDVALLGLGRVGSAVAALALDPPPSYGLHLRVLGALVRDAERPREDSLHRRVRLSEDPSRLFSPRPDVVIEVLGGIEPARTIVLKALERGIAVVTANKSLMAAHGDELLETAAATGATLRYEASVLAGVPFLGTFGSRPLAARISRVTGIVNGTTNFILTKMERERQDFAGALYDAQRLGLAEPNPANDIDGIDAVEKLAVLIRHFGRHRVKPGAIETAGIRGVQALDITFAREFGGAIKPVVDADWSGGALTAFVGPAFVPATHKLSRIDGVENAVSLRSAAAGDLFYSGPGAGPAVTAATILDDVVECCRQPAAPLTAAEPGCVATSAQAPSTGWFVRISSNTLPGGADIADLLGSFGVPLRRISPVDTTTGRSVCYVLTWPATRARVERALSALGDAGGCETACLRTLEN
jgi:homoserine dehydrogenase